MSKYLNIELVKDKMVEHHLSKYRICKISEDKELYPVKIQETNLTKILNGERLPTLPTIKTLGMVLNVPFKNLIKD